MIFAFMHNRLHIHCKLAAGLVYGGFPAGVLRLDIYKTKISFRLSYVDQLDRLSKFVVGPIAGLESIHSQTSRLPQPKTPLTL